MDVGIILGSSWESVWDQVGITLGSLWDHHHHQLGAAATTGVPAVPCSPTDSTWAGAGAKKLKRLQSSPSCSLGKVDLRFAAIAIFAFGIKAKSFQDHVRVTLGPHWDHFGMVLGSLWAHFGITRRLLQRPLYFFAVRQATPVANDSRSNATRRALKTAASKLILTTAHELPPRPRVHVFTPRPRVHVSPLTPQPRMPEPPPPSTTVDYQALPWC